MFYISCVNAILTIYLSTFIYYLSIYLNLLSIYLSGLFIRDGRGGGGGGGIYIYTDGPPNEEFLLRCTYGPPNEEFLKHALNCANTEDVLFQPCSVYPAGAPVFPPLSYHFSAVTKHRYRLFGAPLPVL